jgi:hypothetical protein
MLDDDGAPIQVLDDERAAAILFVGSTTEPGRGAALLGSEPDLPRVPVAEDSIFIVDADLLDASRITHGRLHLQRERRGKRDCGESRHRTTSGSAGT